MDNNRLSLATGERLRLLREERGLSHAALIKELEHRYGIHISRDSLMNYEVSTDYHTKAYKNNGMRIEYLRCLADYYGVSSDWILGLSPFRDHRNERATAYEMGLSEGAADTLLLFRRLTCQATQSTDWKDSGLFLTLNALLARKDFYDLVVDLWHVIASVQDAKESQDWGRLNEYENGRLQLSDFQECEYRLAKLQIDFNRIAESVSGFPELRQAVLDYENAEEQGEDDHGEHN